MGAWVEKVWAGWGRGELCAGCDTQIQPAQTAWAFSTSADGRLVFHLGCAGLWEAERRRRGWSTPVSD